MTITRDDFVVRNILGFAIRTFNDVEMAKAWVRRHTAIHPGLVVEQVTVTETRRPVGFDQRQSA